MRKRGRPSHGSDPDATHQNYVIGRTAYLLAGCGYPRRGARGIFVTISALSDLVLKSTTNVERRKISAGRVEELYEAYLKADFYMPKLSEFTRASLASTRRPLKGTLSDIARKLLTNQGKWTDEHMTSLIDRDSELVMTPKGQAAFEQTFGKYIRTGVLNIRGEK